MARNGVSDRENTIERSLHHSSSILDGSDSVWATNWQKIFFPFSCFILSPSRRCYFFFKKDNLSEHRKEDKREGPGGTEQGAEGRRSLPALCLGHFRGHFTLLLSSY